jgi:hypothetical protein
MSKKYRRKLPATSAVNQTSEIISKVGSPIIDRKLRASTIGAPAAKTSGYDSQKYIVRDIKFSALIALLVALIMVVLYFTIR